MKKIATIITFTSLMILTSACSTQPAPETNLLIKEQNKEIGEVYQFDKVLKAMKENLYNDENYKKIPNIDIYETADKIEDWYIPILYKLWNREIEKETFVREGIKYHPTYRTSFEKQADFIIKNRFNINL